ncbi:hypothetical protein [Streptomyces sp. KLOTTS4A1]|uniref:glycine-rich domain-containing protein n=1 Tax=Streptomyces sp. KLOTTS4A1 TaxID=3390996 RepID=UPI0039F526F6
MRSSLRALASGSAVAAMTAATLLAPPSSASAAPRGTREFTETASFTVPAGVEALQVRAWGAGGGGGGGDYRWIASMWQACPGGGGGAGGFVEGNIPVKPGMTVRIRVGDGGANGTPADEERTVAGTPGVKGGNSAVLVSGRRVMWAEGGQGGDTMAAPGVGGHGQATPKVPGGGGGFVRRGGNGEGGNCGYRTGPPAAGGGYPVTMGTVNPPGFRGQGGQGGTPWRENSIAQVAKPGIDGYVIVRW